MKVRPPAVAGLFYPTNPGLLRTMVTEYLLDARDRAGGAPPAVPGVLRAAVVPHAGYIYSGSTAASLFELIQPIADQIRHVVIVGPAHRVGIDGVALPDAEAMATPIGEVPLWTQGVETALGMPQVVVNDAVHAQEHSLEVQLPFLQMILPEVDVLPLAAGWVDSTVVTDILEALWGFEGTFLLMSSDLSHYHSYEEAQRIDSGTVQQILACNPTVKHDQACGATAVNAMSQFAASHNLTPALIGFRNSGDTAGDKTSVVGYASIGYYD
ncbi:MAG: AmmeMemoRadiSam system protein B [Propionibacteriaceae bacterium]|nr:AmmeMemoRadiSam system protein B [Propionibacteriaceae bacterium]